jgi:hypothetical protein
MEESIFKSLIGKPIGKRPLGRVDGWRILEWILK